MAEGYEVNVFCHCADIFFEGWGGGVGWGGGGGGWGVGGGGGGGWGVGGGGGGGGVNIHMNLYDLQNSNHAIKRMSFKFVEHCTIPDNDMVPLLLTWIYFDPRMEK